MSGFDSESGGVGANPFHEAVYLTGATAVGKTAVGVALARALDAEIVALDSMTLYRGMDVGTAKPDEAERGGVPHHLMDVLEPTEAASVATYRQWAAAAVADIRARGKRVLFVGGAGLHLKALLRGLFEGPGADPALRRELDALSDEALFERLRRVDPALAARLPLRDRKRIARGVEVHALAGRPLSELQREHDRPAPPGVPVIALLRPRPRLHERINARVVEMFDRGLVDEVARLMALDDPPWHPVPAQGVGYKEVADHLRGEYPLERAVELTRIRTRQFAKRQETWFRNLQEVRWFEVSDDETPARVAARVAARLETWNA